MIRLPWLSFLCALALSLFAIRSECAESASGASPQGFAGVGVICDQGDSESCAMPIPRGVATPFSGQLLTPKLAITLGLKAQYCDARTALDVEHAKALVQVDLDSERRLRAIDADAAKAAQALLLKRLEEGNPWYERPFFVSAVVVVMTVSVYALAMKSVDWVKIAR